MFGLNVFGPALKYRLDILYNAAPNITNKILILTDKKSYKFYKEYHNVYEFVMTEDYKDQYQFSTEYELIPNVFVDESDHFKNLTKFYKDNKKNYFYDIQRFIIPAMLDRKVTNFCIIDSDTILINDLEKIERFFDDIPTQSIFAPTFGVDCSFLKEKHNFWKQVKELTNSELMLDIPYGNSIHPYYPEENFSSLFKEKIMASYNDGWCKGFNFSNIDDGKKFFNLWNSAIEMLCINTTKYYSDFKNEINDTRILTTHGMDHRTIWGLEEVSSQLIGIFRREMGYDFNEQTAINPGDITNVKTKELIGRHRPRVEDNLYYGEYNKRGAWYDNTFDYSKIDTIADFIKNNKEELFKYYNSFNFFVEVTDTHVYTKI